MAEPTPIGRQLEHRSASSGGLVDPGAGSVSEARFAVPAPRRQRRWVPWILVPVLAVVAAAATYVVAQQVPPTYSASALLRVTAQTDSGFGQDQVQGENALASQYVQIATSEPVMRRATKELGAQASGLTGSVSASTVSGQNLLHVEASAGSPALAATRANAVGDALSRYARSLNSGKSTGSSALDTQIKATQKAVDALVRKLGRTTTASSADTAILTQQQQLLSQLIVLRQQRGTPTTPQVTVIAPAASGLQTQPKPKLYALIAFVVVLLAGAQIASALRARRRSGGLS